MSPRMLRPLSKRSRAMRRSRLLLVRAMSPRARRHELTFYIVSLPDNPTLSDADRRKIISSLLPDSSSPILSNLMQVLSENQRLPIITAVLTDLSTLMSAHRGELVVTVTSAEPLAANSKEMQRLEKTLRSTQLAKGKELKLVNKVNESILGGLMVDFGDRTIDMSAKSRVTKYSAAIQGESASACDTSVRLMTLL